MPGFHLAPVVYIEGSGVDGPVVQTGSISSGVDSENLQVVRSYVARPCGHRLKDFTRPGMVNEQVAWTNLSYQDQTWAEFSTLEVVACVFCAWAAIKHNGLT
jgi:hypothetical protein